MPLGRQLRSGATRCCASHLLPGFFCLVHLLFTIVLHPHAFFRFCRGFCFPVAVTFFTHHRTGSGLSGLSHGFTPLARAWNAPQSQINLGPFFLLRFALPALSWRSLPCCPVRDAVSFCGTFLWLLRLSAAVLGGISSVPRCASCSVGLTVLSVPATWAVLHTCTSAYTRIIVAFGCCLLFSFRVVSFGAGEVRRRHACRISVMPYFRCAFRLFSLSLFFGFRFLRFRPISVISQFPPCLSGC